MSPPPSGAELARQLRRAQAVARLRHPNLVRLLPLPGGAGLSPVLNEAHRLADFTLPRGTFKRFDLEQVVRLLLDVLSGLAALHEVETDGQAFVHGQVSPLSIYVDRHGTARLVPLPSPMKPEELGYLAPEHANGGGDARADVFSVGVMLWEALAGARLFPAGTAAYKADSALPPIVLAPDARWAAPLCLLAKRAVAFDPDARFASALELSNALAATAAQRLSRVNSDAWQEEAPTPVFQPRLHLHPLFSSTPPPSVVSIAPEATLSIEPPAEVPSTIPRPRRSRALWLAASAVATAAALVLARAPIDWQQAVASARAAAAPAVDALRAPLGVAPPLTTARLRTADPGVAASPRVAAVSSAPSSASSALAVTPSPSSSASLAPSASSSPAASGSAAPPVSPGAPSAKPKAKARGGEDYGI